MSISKADLKALMRADLLQTPPDGLQPLIDKLQARFGEALLGVVLYGSCRRIDDTGEGLVDLMALVSSYSAAHGKSVSALFNQQLPPNVYYLEAESTSGGRIRCKFIVISQAQFGRRCRGGLDGYFWARFTQPCRLAWSASEDVVDQMANDRANAAQLFARRAARLGNAELSAEQFWVRALKATYGSELRPEPPGAADKLVSHDLPFWQSISPAAFESIEFIEQQEKDRFSITPPASQRWIGALDWSARRIWSKYLNILRLLKAAGTFANGLDYLAWKVERHSGVRVEPTDRMRRHPRIAAWGLVWRLWREGAFR